MERSEGDLLLELQGMSVVKITQEDEDAAILHFSNGHQLYLRGMEENFTTDEDGTDMFWAIDPAS